MKIEVFERGMIKNVITVELSNGFDEEHFIIRKLIIENHISQIRKVYPYSSLYLVFESRMNNNHLYENNVPNRLNISLMEHNYWKAKHTDEDNFIRNLIYMRELMEMSQSEMCRRVGYGLKFKTFQSWEERRAFPPIFFCRRISEIFSMDLEVMLTQRLVGKTA